MKLGEVLVNKKLLTAEQLELLLAKQEETNRKLGELMLEKHLVSGEDLDTALQEQYWRRNGYWVIG